MFLLNKKCKNLFFSLNIKSSLDFEKKFFDSFLFSLISFNFFGIILWTTNELFSFSLLLSEFSFVTVINFLFLWNFNLLNSLKAFLLDKWYSFWVLKIFFDSFSLKVEALKRLFSTLKYFFFTFYSYWCYQIFFHFYLLHYPCSFYYFYKVINLYFLYL